MAKKRTFREEFGESFKSGFAESQTDTRQFENIKKRLGFVQTLEEETADKFFENNPKGERRIVGTTEFGTPKYKYLTAQDVLSEKQAIEEANIARDFKKAQTLKLMTEIGQAELDAKQGGKDIFVFDPYSGDTVNKRTGKTVTSIPKDAKLERMGLTPEIVRERNLVKQQTDAISDLRDMSIIQDDLNTVLGYFNQIPQDLKGPVAGRTFGFGADIFKTNEALSTYNREKSFIMANIARRYGGEKGVLTEGDIKRINDALPSLSDSPATARGAIKFVESFIKRRIDSKLKTIETDISTPKQTTKYKVDDIIDVGNKKYKVVGFYDDGEPDVEEVK